MTAEIAVANKHAVALAADSKVTIGGSTAIKTYDTVNKVFTLSKAHPVGIMIFGNAEFMEYPWETIIKLFRQEQGPRDRPHVQNWVDDFRDYLEKFGDIKKEHVSDNINGIVGSWLTIIREMTISAAADDGITIPSDEYTALIVQALNENTDRCHAEALWLTKARGTKVLKDHAAPIMAAVGAVFPKGPTEVHEAAARLAAAALMRQIESPQSSGYVIAGFGEKDIFPTIVESATDGYVGPTIKGRQVVVTDLSRQHSASIRAFAQKEMVQSFMNGVDPSLILTLASMFAEALTNSCLSVLDEYGLSRRKTAATRNKIMDAAFARVETIFDDFSSEQMQKFSGPIMDMVNLLPKDELANLAESLVSLTSLKRRVSRGAETVGGPIDVALISKGDGFIWIKRKHYFTTELNPQFIRNYMNG